MGFTFCSGVLGLGFVYSPWVSAKPGEGVTEPTLSYVLFRLVCLGLGWFFRHMNSDPSLLSCLKVASR